MSNAAMWGRLPHEMMPAGQFGTQNMICGHAAHSLQLAMAFCRTDPVPSRASEMIAIL
jgi:hypothetical protein